MNVTVKFKFEGIEEPIVITENLNRFSFTEAYNPDGETKNITLVRGNISSVDEVLKPIFDNQDRYVESFECILNENNVIFSKENFNFISVNYTNEIRNSNGLFTGLQEILLFSIYLEK